MMGVNPEQMAAVQKVSQHIKGEIRIDYGTSTVSVKLSSAVAEAQELIPGLIEQLGSVLAMQLQSFFAIEGEIIEANKPDAG